MPDTIRRTGRALTGLVAIPKARRSMDRVMDTITRTLTSLGPIPS